MVRARFGVAGIAAVLVLTLFLSDSLLSQSANTGRAWRRIFNGRNLTGWEVVNGGDWKVENGAIVVRRLPRDRSGGWLVTRADFADFRLRMKFRPGAEYFNSGILIRDPGHARVSRPAFNGYEVQLAQFDNDRDENTNGSIYDLARAYPDRMEPDEWSAIEIICRGSHIETYINGKKVAETNSRRSYKGAVGFQLHGGQDDVAFRWKDIEILDLPEHPRSFQLAEEEMEMAPGEFEDVVTGPVASALSASQGQIGAWSFSDGTLTAAEPGETSWVMTRETYADFVLAFDFRTMKGADAGVCLRCAPPPSSPAAATSEHGYKMQIADSDDLHTTGSIVGLARAFRHDQWKNPVHRVGGWNQARVYARGDHIIAYVNRTKTAETHAGRNLDGRIGFQGSPGVKTEYRNIRVKRLTRSGARRQSSATRQQD